MASESSVEYNAHEDKLSWTPRPVLRYGDDPWFPNVTPGSSAGCGMYARTPGQCTVGWDPSWEGTVGDEASRSLQPYFAQLRRKTQVGESG